MLWNALRRGDFQSAIITLALSLPAVILCLTVHEAAHGGMAYLLGDRTARDSGRVTLSPLAHIDPFGFMCLLIFGFGWARPVPVNIGNFKNRKAGMALTAFAGPASNFILAFVAFIGYLAIGYHLLGSQIFYFGASGVHLLMWMLTSGQIAVSGVTIFLFVLMVFLGYTAVLSVGLGVFNLVPIHPLDGSRVLDAFMPFSWSYRIQKYQGIILLVFIAALWFGWLDMLMMMADEAVFSVASRLFTLFL